MIDGEFSLCNLADDLLLLTLDMCDRDGKNPRTPKRIHRSLADRIVLTASAIEEATILANETPPSQQRAAYQQEAMRRCVVLRHQDGKKRAKKREIRMIVRKLEAGELTPEQVQTRYQGWRQRALRAGCRNAVIEMDRRLVLRLQKAGYRTRTTMRGVSIIGKKN